ncbi:hypothetical protein CMEL01_13200 [Colletotrichum melonis]|uniref:Uncharacterized protein n=4 Tax=Colletotrichum acutatum species complex TaxID=2707335 RepID=A0AAJ0DY62_9PEZI|nr:uncharacterized protein CCOS01_10429 [Colletotrichum costaricense]XP_060378563.1 uncharacterized protein CTAM01_10761 [Colletotrichum tamarilloi]KAI3536937.1 hypothetical protein CSPX01_10434 [Colletotrichum filicis]KAK1458625.1 hypothetical protein CCUS01_09289 [Colletotrichum cuscutae]KAK1463131.1 hypothetical protein CMEL01_13200 [Colletotrichum melonis]KAK1490288.1 hypothetical protein CTAM01_10761 [Colletotrichum tamarilloi]KAK1520310.1 hypothetical protein CCOS01_10429 [Colletotrichu
MVVLAGLARPVEGFFRACSWRADLPRRLAASHPARMSVWVVSPCSVSVDCGSECFCAVRSSRGR